MPATPASRQRARARGAPPRRAESARAARIAGSAASPGGAATRLRRAARACGEPAGKGGVFKAHRLCVSLNSRRESNKEEEEVLLKSEWG